MKKTSRKRKAPGRRRSEIEEVLRRMEADPGMGSRQEGENAICMFCYAKVRPCKGNPRYECRERNLGETQLYWLLRQLKEESNGRPATCSICGKKLTTRQLKSTVLRELCRSCRAKSARIHRGNVRPVNRVKKGIQP